MNQCQQWIARLSVFSGLTFLLIVSAHARTTLSFDADWRFMKADAPGAEKSEFDDSMWRTLNVPHDWSIEGPFAQTNKTGGAGAFLPSGVGWYRKAFVLPEETAKQCMFVEFEGVMANSDVWINGHLLGHRPNGYVSFRYELTPHLKFGKGATNVIAVRADTSAQPASRWYTGAGIYRHVRLVTVEPVHLDCHTTFVSTPEIRSNMALVRFQTRVANRSLKEQSVSVMATIQGPPGSAPDGSYGCSGETKSTIIPAGKTVDVSLDVRIPWQPRLWELARPELHTALVRVRSGNETQDEETITFGIRTAEFTSDRGFVLNGKKVMLKGVCLHHDGGALGAAVPLGVWERRLAELKALGCNAIRTSHNPVAPEFLDLCDRMGFLVMDEFFDCWTVGKNRFDYHLDFEKWSLSDLGDTVKRDRNHPSIIVYSAGNEIHDTPQPALAKRILARLVKAYHENDPTRPVTQALFRPNASGDYTNGLADLLDVIGTNYRDKELLAAQQAKEGRKIVGTEQRHDLETWLNCRDNPSHSGQFLWTGIDYLGESRQWPRNSHASGLLDRTGAPKPLAYQRQSWWTEKPMVFVARRVAADDLMPTDPGYGGEERHTQVTFNDWSPHNREAHPENVEVYSNCEDVELLLNGRSLGSKKKPADDSPRKWTVTFQAGELVAVGRSGDIVVKQTIRTAGVVAKLVLSADAAQVSPAWDDVVFVRARITDENDNLVPASNNLVRFSISDPGQIVAVDNGDCMSTESFQGTERKAYGGCCVAIVRATASTGKITVTAEVDGLLIKGSAEIECRSANAK